MSKHAIGTGPIEQRYFEEMQDLGRLLDNYLNREVKPPAQRTTGFVLMVFSFGPGERMNYISNADRRDVIAALREQLSYFEGMPDSGRGQA